MDSHGNPIPQDDRADASAIEKPIQKKAKLHDSSNSHARDGWVGESNIIIKKSHVHDPPTPIEEKSPEGSWGGSPIIKKKKLEVPQRETSKTKTGRHSTPESHARHRLHLFLEKRSVKISQEDFDKIHITTLLKPNKIAGDTFEEGNYTITYEYHNQVYPTRPDLLKALISLKQQKNAAGRDEVHAASKKMLERTSFPLNYNKGTVSLYDMELISPGVLKNDPQFISSTQIYPVGYNSHVYLERGTPSQMRIVCEIQEKEDGSPQFSIEVSGGVPDPLVCLRKQVDKFYGSSEEEVWQEFDPDRSFFSTQSFFNLDIELLLEGLEGALEAAGYKFHCERGYGINYMTHEEAVAAKESFVARTSRSERSRQKQDARRNIEIEAAALKSKMGRKPMSEEERLRKEEDRLREKRDSKLMKVKTKEEQREQKESQKKSDKARGQLKKEVMGDVRKCRADAASAVLQSFDAEEDLMEGLRLPPVAASSNAVRLELSDLVRSLPPCGGGGTFPSDGTASVRWDDLVYVANSLLLFRDTLKLNISSDLDHLHALIRAACDGDTAAMDMASPVSASALPTTAAVKQEETADTSVPMETAAPTATAADDDEVWDETAVPTYAQAPQPSPLKAAAGVSLSKEDSGTKAEVARAFLERIVLSLLKVLAGDLGALLDTERDKASPGLRLPLNQLTWPEHARMLFVARLSEDVAVVTAPKAEELLFAIRGNKGLGFRSNKNIARNIRYHFVAADRRDRQELDVAASRPQVDYSALPTPANFNDFFSEAEMEAGLVRIAADDSYDEAYRRCAKVLVKMIGLTICKNMLWEVDANQFPYYYTLMKRPIMLCNIATNLVSKAYGEADTPTGTISVAFYRDVAHCAFNCFAFNSEVNSVGTQGAKVLHTLRRHMSQWVWGVGRPAVEHCSESYCFLTLDHIPPNVSLSSLKCAKCFACYNLASLDAHEHFAHFGFSNELVTNHMEEWYCLYCVQEDVAQDKNSSMNSTASTSKYAYDLPAVNQLFVFNSWGLSGSVPWIMNEVVSSRVAEVLQDDEIKVRFEALAIMCSQERLQRLSQGDTVTVLRALCDLLKYNARCVDFVTKLQSNCNKLLKMTEKDSFREAELLEAAKLVVGDAAVAMFRNVFDGTEDSEAANLQSRVIEGRCTICKGSTYEEDTPEEEEVVLCDGCNGEAHLKCLHLTEVPKEAWHCAACAERIAARESSLKHTFNDVEKYRSQALEEQLTDVLIDLKIANKQLEDISREQCEYCGCSELDLCSPLVVGHCRDEHEAYIDSRRPAMVNGLIEGRRNTSIKFSVRGHIVNSPLLTVPYFPALNSFEGEQLQTAITPVVHELCALNMFKARMDKERHSFRRRRRVAAERVIWMSGVTLQPLGFDDTDTEYWRFPTSPHLFICMASDRQQSTKEQLRNLLTSGSFEESKEAVDRKVTPRLTWRRAPDVGAIRRIVDLLGRSTEEAKLKQAIIVNFLSDVKAESAGAEDVSKDDSPTVVSDAAVKEAAPLVAGEKKPGPDKTPSELRLINGPKCLSIDRDVLIEEEEAFEEALEEPDEDEEEEDTESYTSYFKYSRKQVFYAVAIKSAEGKTLSFPKGSVTITYQIHRGGSSEPLTFTPLDQAWNDGIYYFSAIEYKRSGNYTISFIAEGASVAFLKPLVFPVTVKAKSLKYGPMNALLRLRARDYVAHRDRQISMSKRIYAAFINDVSSELDTIRSALLSFYYALPGGSLPPASAGVELAEADGWSPALDVMWQGRVAAATTPLELMECLMLLEFYLDNQCFDKEQTKLLAALPSAHFAMRCCSMAAIAVRLFTMDRVLLYDSAVVPKMRREKATPAFVGATSKKTSRQQQPQTSRYVEADDNEDDDEGYARNKRARKPVQRLYENAADRYAEAEDEQDRPSRRHQQQQSRRRGGDDSDGDNYDEEGAQQQPEKLSSAPQPWVCVYCSCENSARARSCEACGERKTAASAISASSSKQRTASSLLGKKRHSSLVSTSSRGRSSVSSRPSSRPRISYTEPEDDEEGDSGEDNNDDDDDEQEEEEDEENVAATSTSVAGVNTTSGRRREAATASGNSGVSADMLNRSKVDVYGMLAAKEREVAEATAAATGEEDEDALATAQASLHCLQVLVKLYEYPDTDIFWAEVDPKLVPSYREIIATPMDLGTITRQVFANFYGTDYPTFLKKVQLVWSNCRKFNRGSTLAHFASELNDYFDELCKEILPSFPDSEV